ncbi:hypothetical protein POM88_012313 [Heracleum sosnowskyi]|uniref:Peptidase A2 domain-containing protein n=1 Tax=Heracleum sosnowskyi TaxID=360622 RepID=A0AAD8N2C7_9APIA|nr:hypothetical protein POM88_012313 [Heracleum sosnowskyi]
MTVVGEALKRARTEISIGFDDSDLEGVKFPHNDPLVIVPVIGNSETKRVLIDNGASVDILFHDAFIKMGYTDSQLTPSNMHIYRFNGVESKVEGTIQLLMTMGQGSINKEKTCPSRNTMFIHYQKGDLFAKSPKHTLNTRLQTPI